MPADTEHDVNSAETVGEICARLATGETTRKITRGMGSNFERAFWKRMQSDSAFAATISRARETGQETLTAETIDIADAATEENVNSARLRIWARQWYASKLAPKKYGDKLGLGAADGLDPVTVKLATPLSEIGPKTPT
jgi:hypothetical protein